MSENFYDRLISSIKDFKNYLVLKKELRFAKEEEKSAIMDKILELEKRVD